MTNNSTSNNLKKDETNLNIKETDYMNLITKLKEMGETIAQLEKIINL